MFYLIKEFLQEIEGYYGTFSLIVISTSFYFLLNLIYGFEILTMPDKAIIEFGQVNYLVLNEAKWYQLLTAMFLHSDLAHLGSNMLFLLIYGIRYEELRNTRDLLIVYLISGLIGNVFTLLIPDIITLGASGAVFGIFGALLVVLREHRIKNKQGLIFLAIMYFTLTIDMNTNIIAHLGGFLGGIIVQYLIFRLKK